MSIKHRIKSLLAFLIWMPWGFKLMVDYMIEDDDIEF